MARLGELLVAAGLLTPDQVEQALRAQVMWGGRLGTNLIELGYVDLDTLSATLGRQHRLPAALARHFEKADPELQKRLAPDVAERYSIVPIRQSGPQKLVVFASVDVIDKRGLELIAAGLEVGVDELVPSIAAELRIRYHLERAYKIPRGTRFLRARGASIPPFPHLEITPAVTFEDVSQVDIPIPGSDLGPGPAQIRGDVADRQATEPDPPRADTAPDAEPVADAEADSLPIAHIDDLADFSELALLDEPLDEPTKEIVDDIPEDGVAVVEPTGRDRRRYVPTIADEPTPPQPLTDPTPLGRIAIRKVAAPIGTTIGEATRAIRRSIDRDRVAELVLSTIDRFLPECDAAMLLVVRGDVAISWKGFCRSGEQLPDIGVPLDQGGLAPRAILRCTTTRAPSSDLGTIDQLLLAALGKVDGDLAVVPISIAGNVMCLIALVTAADAPVIGAESIAASAGAAFARLMKHAAR